MRPCADAPRANFDLHDMQIFSWQTPPALHRYLVQLLLSREQEYRLNTLVRDGRAGAVCGFINSLSVGNVKPREPVIGNLHITLNAPRVLFCHFEDSAAAAMIATRLFIHWTRLFIHFDLERLARARELNFLHFLSLWFV